MSCKVPINNGINVNELQWSKSSSLDTNVKLAGEEAKDRLYEPKHKKKLVRVLTVIAYVFFVSLAAIMLSLYYVFLWNGDKRITSKYPIIYPASNGIKCDTIVAEMQQQITPVGSDEVTFPAVVPTGPAVTTTEENTTFPDYENVGAEIDDLNSSTLFKKLMFYKKYQYAEYD